MILYGAKGSGKKASLHLPKEREYIYHYPTNEYTYVEKDYLIVQIGKNVVLSCKQPYINEGLYPFLKQYSSLERVPLYLLNIEAISQKELQVISYLIEKLQQKQVFSTIVCTTNRICSIPKIFQSRFLLKRHACKQIPIPPFYKNLYQHVKKKTLRDVVLKLYENDMENIEDILTVLIQMKVREEGMKQTLIDLQAKLRKPNYNKLFLIDWIVYELQK